jgi:hypothetical protein
MVRKGVFRVFCADFDKAGGAKLDKEVLITYGTGDMIVVPVTFFITTPLGHTEWTRIVEVTHLRDEEVDE